MANLSAFGGAQPLYPGGTVELGYAEKTSNTTITSTSPTSPTATGLSVTVVSDGSPMTVEFYCGEATPPNVNNGVMLAALWVDGAEYDRTMGVLYNYSDGVNSGRTIYAKKRITLAAGSHTIDIRGWLANNAGLSGYYFAGTNVSGFSPAYIRVSKIVNQNDGLKPFWTPPIVTSLPTAATVGDQVVYAADATNGVYWSLYYDGIGTYPWKYIGGPPLYDAGGGYQAITSTSYVDLTGVTINTALAGDYDVRLDAQLQQPTGNGYVTYLSVSHAGGTLGDYTYPIVYAPFTSSTDNGASRVARILDLAANNTLQGRAKVNAGTGYVGYCRLTATPVRVAA